MVYSLLLLTQLTVNKSWLYLMNKKQYNEKNLFNSKKLNSYDTTTINKIIAKQKELEDLLRKYNYDEDDIIDLTYVLEIGIIKRLLCLVED